MIFFYSQTVENPSMSLSPTLNKNENVEHHIRIKAYNPITSLRFLVKRGVLMSGLGSCSLLLYLQVLILIYS